MLKKDLKFPSISNGLLKIVAILILIIPASCGGDLKKTLAPATSNIIESQNELPDTSIKFEWKNQKRTIYFMPAKGLIVKGTVLLLHGWNLPPLGWCESTNLCDALCSAGYNIVIPDMGKSMYASQFFPETMAMMREYPQRTWLIDTVLPALADEYGIFTPETDNFIIGLSTGARGAFALGLNCSQRFDGIVMLSGDYDQSIMQDDNIMTYFYGDYESFPDRWEGTDNLFNQAEGSILPIYIGHGMDDQVVPVEQSQLLYKKLSEHSASDVESNFPSGYGHNYEYWESETENIINWLNKLHHEIAATK